MIDYLNKYNLTNEQKEQFNKYFCFLIEQNKVMNLTAITEEAEVYIKHFFDSLLVDEIVNLNNINTLCDIGSGAGFPSIPLKIVFPHLDVTIIEPIKKRANFLNQVIELLNLKNIEVVNARAEDAIDKYRDFFDLVCARAVARLNILLELCLPFVKVTGSFVAMKGSSYQSELDESKKAIAILSGKLDKVENLDLPQEMGQRSLLKFLKTSKINPTYPRHFSKIKKNPL